MSAPVLLNLLNQLRKSDKMRGLPSLMNSIIQEHNVRFYLSYDITINLKFNFCHKNVMILSL